MEPGQNPEPNSPPKNSFTWPVIINLTLLLFAAMATGGNANGMGLAVAALALLNAITAAIAGFKGKLKWVVIFVFTALLILLLGLGTCALMFNGLGRTN